MNLKETLKSLKLHESTISMFLGALVIVVVGVLLINYFSGKQGQTVPPLEVQQEASLPTTHTVQEGEDLWKISEKYYKSGYNWEDIAQANNITDANRIEVGQVLTIPNVQPKLAEGSEVSLTPTLVSQSVSPTGQAQEVVAVEPEQPGTQQTHVVLEGETLWTISEKYYNSGYNWVDISDENNLTDPNLISAGQTLTIPATTPKLLPTAASTETMEPISGTTYMVVKGDSLWEIALRAYGDGYRWVEIARVNALTNPSIIHTGNELTLPR